MESFRFYVRGSECKQIASKNNGIRFGFLLYEEAGHTATDRDALFYPDDERCFCTLGVRIACIICIRRK